MNHTTNRLCMITLALPLGLLTSTLSAGNLTFVQQPLLPFGLESLPTWNKPALGDLDGDGDLDLLIGTGEGYLVQFNNVGTKWAPVFERQPTGPLGNGKLESNFAPTLVDFDGDGDLDLFAGNVYGYTFFYRNQGNEDEADFVREGGDNPFQIPKVSGNSVPQFVQLDGDGLFDLVMGEYNGDVTIFYSVAGENEGFTFDANVKRVVASLDEFNSSAASVDIEPDGDFDFFVGSRGGNTWFFNNQGNQTFPNHFLDPSTTFGIPEFLPGDVTMVEFGDLNGDTLPDAVVGLNGTTVIFINSPTTGTATEPFVLEHGNRAFTIRQESPTTVAFVDLNGDGDFDALTAESSDVVYFENTWSPQSPSLQKRSPAQAGFSINTSRFDGTPVLAPVDLEGDGDFDVFALGYVEGVDRYELDFFLNTGNETQATFVKQPMPPSGLPTVLTNERFLTFSDLNGDQKPDAVFGLNDGGFNVSLNTSRGGSDGSVNIVSFTTVSEINPFGLAPLESGYSSIVFNDFDGDGDADAISGQENGKLFYHQNTGSTSVPVFVLQMAPEDFGLSVPSLGFSTPSVQDLDGDGDADLAVGFYNQAPNSPPTFVRYYKNETSTIQPVNDAWIVN